MFARMLYSKANYEKIGSGSGSNTMLNLRKQRLKRPLVDSSMSRTYKLADTIHNNITFYRYTNAFLKKLPDLSV